MKKCVVIEFNFVIGIEAFEMGIGSGGEGDVVEEEGADREESDEVEKGVASWS